MSDSQYTVLVVDDNDLNRDMLGRRLERKGFRVVPARDGFEALMLVEKDGIDLVLLDIMMPGMSGIEVLGKLREHYSHTDLPIIMATARDQNEDMVQAFEAGANDYVVKPLDFRVVLARVQAHLRTVSAARRARQAAAPEEREGGRPTLGAAGSDAPQVGSVLVERYRLESKIGKGNFGDVYRAVHLSLERPVAVKVLQTRVDGSSSHLDRFRQEGISSCRLDHPNAVNVMDFGVTPNGVAYLVMELLEGRHLGVELKEEGPLSPQRCVEILPPVCEVLAQAHGMDIIHRDIKPGNIFLHQYRGEEVVKVVDFGIAKLAGEAAVRQNLTIDGGIIGTPAYMAPERLTGREYDGRSDVYSLGVMLFEMLTGELPFGGTTDPMALAFMHVQKPPPLLRSVRPELPRSLEALVNQTLDKDYRMRPTAELLARKLRRAVAISPQAEPPGSRQAESAAAQERSDSLPGTIVLPPE